jgi:phage/plasmid-associated DNA primase
MKRPSRDPRRSKNNPIKDFIRQRTEVPDDDPRFPTSEIQAAVLYRAYCEFMTSAGRPPIGRQIFGRVAKVCFGWRRTKTAIFYGPLKLKDVSAP